MFLSTPDMQAHDLTPDELGLQVETPAGAVPWYLSGRIAVADAAYVVQPFRAASLAASYLRIAGDLGYANCDPVVVGSGVKPTWDAVNGWKYNGINQFLNSGFVPIGEMSIFIRFTNVTNQGWICGSLITTAGRFDLAPNNIGTRVVYGNGSTNADRNLVPPPILSGTLGISGKQPYRNGSPDGAVISGVNISGVILPMYIGAGNPVATLVYGAFYLQYLAVYKTIISAAQQAALTAATA